MRAEIPTLPVDSTTPVWRHTGQRRSLDGHVQRAGNKPATQGGGVSIWQKQPVEDHRIIDRLHRAADIDGLDVEPLGDSLDAQGQRVLRHRKALPGRVPDRPRMMTAHERGRLLQCLLGIHAAMIFVRAERPPTDILQDHDVKAVLLQGVSQASVVKTFAQAAPAGGEQRGLEVLTRMVPAMDAGDHRRKIVVVGQAVADEQNIQSIGSCICCGSAAGNQQRRREDCGDSQ